MAMFTFNYKESAGFTDEEVHSTSLRLKAYIEHLNEVTHRTEYDGLETSINLSYDENLHNELKSIVDDIKNKELKYVFVVGIGGSNLGPMAVYDAVLGAYELLHERGPKLIFVDTLSPALHKGLHQMIDENITDKNEFLISIVSKSGSTTETIGNFESLHAYLADKFGDIYERVLVTTQEGSPLWKKSQNRNYKLVNHRNVGGRFSIMSPVGQIPLLLAGLDVKSLLKGAQEARDVCLSGDLDTNLAAVSASLLFNHYKKGVPMNDNFFFNREMESVGKWYRQLMGESIGKEEDMDGKKVNAGLTPMVSIGSTDLHSMAQLYLGGPRNKFTNFVYSQQTEMNVTVPRDQVFDGLVQGIEGRNFVELMDAIYEGTKIAYMKKDLPFMEVVLPEINEESLGQYMQFKMIEMMYLGKLMNVNPFNQPNVEDYKIETRKILDNA